MQRDRSWRPFVGVSLKMHLSHAHTKAWLRSVAMNRPDADQIDVAVLPSFTALDVAAEALRGTDIALGAQNCFWEDTGAFTGEVSPAVIREIGCSYVEVGHAERRRIFGEDNDMIARKAVAAACHGLTPIICIGEGGQTQPDNALRECLTQLNPVLSALQAATEGDAHAIVAYEPVWAIGAPAPASATHIEAIVAGLRTYASAQNHCIRIIYGGSAGPGLFGQIRGIDGLFLGRSALDPQRFAATVDEVVSATVRRSPHRSCRHGESTA